MTAGPAPHCLRLLALAGLLLMPAAAHAQELTVRGRVLGPDDNPLAAQRVVLHRVDAAGGATIAEDTSAADGTFELRAAASIDTAAVYFLASRFNGELYIGPPFKPEQQSMMEQLIQVGVPGTSADQLMRGEEGGAIPVGRPATSRSWLLLLIPLLGVAAVALYMLVPRTRISAERTVLMRVAELDERMATATAAQRASLRDERARLLAMLRGG
ncbi:MAG TPA: hypothetical protein VMN60_12785 [Longimicrobiales bacterium]|nr:hypothetical protein [Longimicrobiales bacterium]